MSCYPFPPRDDSTNATTYESAAPLSVLTASQVPTFRCWCERCPVTYTGPLDSNNGFDYSWRCPEGHDGAHVEVIG